MKKRYYTNNSVIPNRVEWACGDKVFLYAVVFCLIAIAIIYILTCSLKTKFQREKEIAFRAGYAKALMMDELPEELPY